LNKEIINTIASLKNNKANSFDQILNKMLKFGQTYIIDPLCKLFNNILSTGKFPVDVNHSSTGISSDGELDLGLSK
jgi:hypothetical protein